MFVRRQNAALRHTAGYPDFVAERLAGVWRFEQCRSAAAISWAEAGVNPRPYEPGILSRDAGNRCCSICN